MSRHLSTRNISSKSMHAFLSNLATRQRDRQTNTGKKHLPPPLSEVKIVNEKPQIKVVGIKRLNIIIIRPIHAFIMRAHSVVILNQRRNHSLTVWDSSVICRVVISLTLYIIRLSNLSRLLSYRINNHYDILVKQPVLQNLPRDAYKWWEFRKNCANESALRGKFMAKIRNFDSFGGCISTFLPSAPVPTFTFIGATCRPCGAKNPFLGQWVKTIPTWLRYAQTCR